MLIPLIANSPLQGPPPTPISDHGAAEDHARHAAKDDTKDVFGALFREGDMTKKPPQPATSQETSLPVDSDTPEDDIETEPDVTAELIASEPSDQGDAPDHTETAETATLVAQNRFDPDTQNDLGKHVAPNPEPRIDNADQDADLGSLENRSSLSATPASLPLKAGLEDATEVNKTIANASMGAKENMVPDQEGPATQAAPALNGNVAASTTGLGEKAPIESPKAQPLTASAAAIIAKASEDSTLASKRDQASALAESASIERALDQAVKADRPTMPGAPVHPANASSVQPRQYLGPAQGSKSLTTEIETSALDDKPLVFEARTLGASTAAMAVPTQTLAHRADQSQHIAMQIAAAAQRGGPGRPIDIVLNPAELGRVRLSLSSVDGVMSVTVIAERPETLDLMRRHIDTLAQEFLNIGYGKAQFSFGGGQSGQTGQEHGDTSHSLSGGSGSHAPITETPNLHHTPILISDRLDIRL